MGRSATRSVRSDSKKESGITAKKVTKTPPKKVA